MPDNNFQLFDTGQGIDSAVVGISFSDTAVGSDIALMGLFSDFGYANDSIGCTVDITFTDSGQGIDSAGDLNFIVFDAAVGLDSASTIRSIVFTDSGVGSDLTSWSAHDFGVGMDHGTSYVYDAFLSVSLTPLPNHQMNIGLGWKSYQTWYCQNGFAFGNDGMSLTPAVADQFQLLVDVYVDTNQPGSSSSSSSSSSSAAILYQQGFALCAIDNNNCYRAYFDTQSNIIAISVLINGNEVILASAPFTPSNGWLTLTASKNGPLITFTVLHYSTGQTDSVTANINVAPGQCECIGGVSASIGTIVNGINVGLTTTMFVNDANPSHWPIFSSFRCWSLVGCGPAVARSTTFLQFGVGCDCVLIGLKFTDSGVGISTATLDEAMFTLTDFGHGSDRAIWLFQDSGVGTDSVSQLLITVTDSGVGTEVISMARTVLDYGHGIDYGSTYILDLFSGSLTNLPSHPMNIGSGWIVLGGSIWYSSGGVAFGNGSMAVTKAVNDNFAVLVDITVDLAIVSSSSSSSSSWGGLIRYQQGIALCVSDVNNGYRAYVDTQSRVLEISKVVAGIETILASVPFTLGSGTIGLSLVKQGTSITITATHYSNGTSTSVTATNIATTQSGMLQGLFVGMTTTLFISDANPADWPRFSDFRCWNLIGSGVATSFAPSVSDVGLGTDTAKISFNFPDTGIGVDTVKLLLSVSDTGAGVDSIADRGAIFRDSGIGTITISAVDRNPVVDSGHGVDLVGLSRPSPEVGVGTDTLSLSVHITVSDSGVGSDAAVGLTNILVLVDFGLAADFVSLDADIGILEDNGVGQEYFIAAPGGTAYPFGDFEPGER